MRIAYVGRRISEHDCKWINLFAEKNEVLLICSKQADDYPLLSKRVEVHEILPASYPFSNFLYRGFVVKRLKKLFKEREIDIVHSMYSVPNSFWVKHTGFKNHVVTTRGSDILVEYNHFKNSSGSFHDRVINRYFLKQMHQSLNRASLITSTSSQQIDVIRTFVNDESKLHVIRTGVDVDRFLNELSRCPVAAADIFTIFSPRGMSPIYRIERIIDVAIALRKFWPNFKFKVILINDRPKTPYSVTVMQKIRHHHLEEFFEIHPYVFSPEMACLYKRSNLVIMLPKSDGTPVTGVETMLARKPLIVSNLPYDENLFANGKIWKVDSGEPEKIASLIVKISGMKEELLREITDSNYLKAAELASLKNEVEKIENFYYKIAGLVPLSVREKAKQACSRCLMDTMDDPVIAFDKNGVCNYCHEYDKALTEQSIQQSKEGELMQVLEEMKRHGQGNKYDCVLGISGGADSSYLAYLAKQLGLRALLVHYDNGWNSELAVKNIQNIVQQLDFDLYTYVNDWEEFKDIQLAFLKASVLDVELITDQAIVALLYKVAQREKVRYIITGHNLSTEAVLPPSWYHWKIDLLNIRAIHRRYGRLKLTTYPSLGFFEKLYFDKFVKLKNVSLLNYVPYVKSKAKEILAGEIGWRDYSGKHGESIFTRFFQSYYLPQKFQIDKRKAHLSSLICSGQITREQALEELKKPLYDEALFRSDKEFVLKKLGLSEDQFEKIMAMAPRAHSEFPSYFSRHYRYQKMISDFLKKLGVK